MLPERLHTSNGILSRIDAARRALAEARTVDELKDIRDQAQAVAHYLKQRNLCFEAQQDAAEIGLRAARKLGEMLRENVDHAGGKRAALSNSVLPDGVSRMQSHRWQKLARIQDDEFENYVQEARADNQELTTAAVMRLAKSLEKRDVLNGHGKQDDACEVKDLQRLVAAGTRFGTIYADPPWRYDNQGTRASTDNHYATMALEEIAALPVTELAAEKCHLHLWATDSFLEAAMGLLKGWGFERRQTFVWVKPQLGIGNYWRSSHEYLLLGVKGGLTFPPSDIKSWIQHDRTRHSAKPEAVRKLIERVSPAPRLELFARHCVDGWVMWGNQIERGMFDDDIKQL